MVGLRKNVNMFNVEVSGVITAFFACILFSNFFSSFSGHRNALKTAVCTLKSSPNPIHSTSMCVC